MIFSNDKAIYLQMADRLCDDILAGRYQDDDRIPSVREYSVLLEVNTNTAVKAYEQLAKEFMKERLPELFRQMALLEISIDDVVESYKEIKSVK